MELAGRDETNDPSPAISGRPSEFSWLALGYFDTAVSLEHERAFEDVFLHAWRAYGAGLTVIDQLRSRDRDCSSHGLPVVPARPCVRPCGAVVARGSRGLGACPAPEPTGPDVGALPARWRRTAHGPTPEQFKRYRLRSSTPAGLGSSSQSSTIQRCTASSGPRDGGGKAAAPEALGSPRRAGYSRLRPAIRREKHTSRGKANSPYLTPPSFERKVGSGSPTIRSSSNHRRHAYFDPQAVQQPLPPQLQENGPVDDVTHRMPVIVYVYRHPWLDVMVAFVRNSCSSIVVCGTLPAS